MKTEKNILIAFLMNLFFSIFEFVGGTITGSVAIISDSVHDLGDAASIGVSYFLEHISKRQPDEKYSYGYLRFSVLGSVITTVILLIGSMIVIYNAICRIISPVDINYNGMIIIAVAGVILNSAAAIITREGDSINQKAVNLHMFEDVLGWVIVLFGAIIMRFTDIAIFDPIMSIGVAVVIIVMAVKTLKEALNVFLEKTPSSISIDEIHEHILKIDGVTDVHHIHIWSIDGQINYATMHIVTDSEPQIMKELIRAELIEHGIAHSTLEFEKTSEECQYRQCVIEEKISTEHHHHS